MHNKYIIEILLSTKKAKTLELRKCNKRKYFKLQEGGKDKSLLKVFFKLTAVGELLRNTSCVCHTSDGSQALDTGSRCTPCHCVLGDASVT